MAEDGLPISGLNAELLIKDARIKELEETNQALQTQIEHLKTSVLEFVSKADVIQQELLKIKSSLAAQLVEQQAEVQVSERRSTSVNFWDTHSYCGPERPDFRSGPYFDSCSITFSACLDFTPRSSLLSSLSSYSNSQFRLSPQRSLHPLGFRWYHHWQFRRRTF